MLRRSFLVALAGLLSAVVLLAPMVADAKGSGGGGGSSSKSTYVHGYTRKDGTYVSPHYRSVPDSSTSGPTGHGSAGTYQLESPRHPAGGSAFGTGTHERSSAARDDFQRKSPCPSTGQRSGACPGYVVDHVVPLKRGGADDPSNMQWQTVEAAKAKDRVE